MPPQPDLFQLSFITHTLSITSFTLIPVLDLIPLFSGTPIRLDIPSPLQPARYQLHVRIPASLLPGLLSCLPHDQLASLKDPQAIDRRLSTPNPLDNTVPF